MTRWELAFVASCFVLGVWVGGVISRAWRRRVARAVEIDAEQRERLRQIAAHDYQQRRKGRLS